LDFSFSPYVALYFATSGDVSAGRERPEYCEIWAIDCRTVIDRAQRTGFEAIRQAEQHKKAGPPRSKGGKLSMHPANFASDIHVLQAEDARNAALLQKALRPSTQERYYLQSSGLVMPAMPSWENARLSAQQGLFLLNASISMSFRDSLFHMMEGVQDWCHRLLIPTNLNGEIQRYLVSRMNLHEFSLFPDMDGLARFLVQKVELFG
jgi:hypothetical protein